MVAGYTPFSSLHSLVATPITNGIGTTYLYYSSWLLPAAALLSRCTASAAALHCTAALTVALPLPVVGSQLQHSAAVQLSGVQGSQVLSQTQVAVIVSQQSVIGQSSVISQ